MYRGQPVYDRAVKSDIRWLDSNLEELKQKIDAAQRKDAVLPDISLTELEGFVTAGESPAGSTVLASQQLMKSAASSDAIPRYIQKLP